MWGLGATFAPMTSTPTRLDPLTPPEPLAMPVIICPACFHGIDPHGTDPGGRCGVGDEQRHLCPCLWSPNDIAAHWMSAARPGPYVEQGFFNADTRFVRDHRVGELPGRRDPIAIGDVVALVDDPQPTEPCS